jgi:hypothetical protein
MHGFTRRKKQLTALGVVVAIAAAGSAFAYWTGAGGGSGTAGVQGGGSVTLTASVPDNISPGNSSDVTFTAANLSDAPIRVGTVTLDSVTATGGLGTCDTSDFTMADVVENQSIPSLATVEPLLNDGSLAYALTGVDQDGCKGATLTLTLSST